MNLRLVRLNHTQYTHFRQHLLTPISLSKLITLLSDSESLFGPVDILGFGLNLVFMMMLHMIGIMCRLVGDLINYPL